MGYQYSNLAGATTLAADITSGATSLTLASASGLPGTYPYTLILDPDTVAIEVVTVTGPAVAGAYPVLRGEDGTVAQAHTAGAKVIHGLVSRDLKGPQDHIAATTNVHGVTGSVVGTTDTQTLSGKTINGASNTLTIRDADIAALSASKLTGGGANLTSTTNAQVPLTVAGTAAATGNLLSVKKGSTEIVFIDPAGKVSATRYDIQASGGASTALAILQPGDSAARLVIDGNGNLSWGPGGAASQDTSVGRASFGKWIDWSGSFSILPDTSGTFSLGNGTVKAQYIQVGKIVTYQFSLGIGSTTTFGTGSWQFNPPVAPMSAATGAAVGSAIIKNGGGWRPGTMSSFSQGGGGWYMFVTTGTGLAVAGATGAGNTWASGDVVKGQIIYEAA